MTKSFWMARKTKVKRWTRWRVVIALMASGMNQRQQSTLVVMTPRSEHQLCLPNACMDQAKMSIYYYYSWYLLIDTRVAKDTANRPKPTSESKFYTLLLSMYSSREMTKAASKCAPVSASLEFLNNKSWTNVCSQILTKISAALNPPDLMITNYSIHATSTRVISKPGLPLNSEEDYALVLKHLSKAKGDNIIISATICEKPQPGSDSEANKENDEAKKSKAKSKKVYNLQPICKYLTSNSPACS